jgi:hypothetical protein
MKPSPKEKTMRLFSWLKNWTGLDHSRGARRTGSGRKPATRCRLTLEVLECRDVPSTLTVTSLADGGNPGDGSLRSAITAAHAGDTIVFDSTLSNQTITLTSGQLVINKSLTIQGYVGIDGGGQGGSRVFEVDGAQTNVTLSVLTISGGQGTAFPQSFQTPGSFDGLGGGIYNAGNLTLNCNIINNGGYYGTSGSDTSSVRAGGGIYNAGTLTVVGTISGNYAGDEFGHQGNGGGIYNAGTLTVSSNLSDNHAYGSGADGGNGGGIYNAANATATVKYDTHITENSASILGGGIYNAGTLTLGSLNSWVWVMSNTAASKGAGIFNNKGGRLTIQSSTVRYNVDASGLEGFEIDVYNLGQMKVSKNSDIGFHN